MGALEVSKPSSTGKEGAPGVDNSVVRLPVSGSADAELKEALYAVIMALRGINATMAYTALFNRDHVQDDSDRIERAFCIIHKMQSADAPKRSGGKRRKANEKS
jgi:hypothetical protein